MLISLPHPTQMLHFGQFALPSEKQGSAKRDLIRKSQDQRSLAPPRAYRSLPRPSSLTKPSHSPTGVFALFQVHHFLLLQPRKFYVNISVKPHFSTLSVDIVACFCDPLHDGHRRYEPAASFTPNFHMELHIFGHTNTYEPFTQKLSGPLN